MERTMLVVAPVNDAQKARLIAAAPTDTRFVFRDYESVCEEDVRAAHILFGNVKPALLPFAERLQWLQLNSAGADAYTRPGVLPEGCRLTTAVGAYGLAVSEHALAMLLSMFRKLPLYMHNQSRALWQSEGTVQSVEGSTVLILGAGNIGCDFARKVKALGAYTVGTRRAGSDKPDCLDELHTLESLDVLLPRADAVAVCLPLTKETERLFNAKRLALMKETAVLINVGRGAIIDTDALVEALTNNAIGGACLDVTDPEPLPAGHPLWQCENALITPHVAGFFYLPETMERVVSIVCENLRRYFAGEALINDTPAG